MSEFPIQVVNGEVSYDIKVSQGDLKPYLELAKRRTKPLHECYQDATFLSATMVKYASNEPPFIDLVSIHLRNMLINVGTLLFFTKEIMLGQTPFS